FRHCKYVLLNISADNIYNSEEIKSIDEAIEALDGSSEFLGKKIEKFNPEMIFWAHCSNLQVWHENNYNTSLLHSNLSFPLLKELSKVGDLKAQKIFNEEIAKRFESNNITVVKFLLYSGYLTCLNKEELEIVLDQIKIKFSKLIINNLRELMKSPTVNYRKINDLIDVITFIDLQYNLNLSSRIINTLSEKLRIEFARFLILHLNYKEFVHYKIPYGNFAIYFEDLLDLIYENCPEIKDLINLIDSGFLSGLLALEDKYSYGTQFYP
ncbi:MAG: hypothetical protein ACFE9S_19585, partial [Candidatus Hermodarchaeota archaeon]